MIVRELITKLGFKIDQKAIDAYDKAMGGAKKKSEEFTGAAKGAGKAAAGAGDAAKAAGQKIKGAGDNAAGASAKVKTFGDRMKEASGRMKELGQDLSLKVSLPLLAAATFAAKAAISYESAFAGVRKTVDGTPQQLQDLSNGFRAMALSIPVDSVNDLAAIGEAAGQLGIKTKSILDFTRVIVDLGNSTNLKGEEGASALAKFTNITGMDPSKYRNLGSAIVALGNDGASTEKDIVDMGLRIAGAGRQAGLAEHQILAFSSGLSSLGLESEAGGTAFSTLLSRILTATRTGGGALDQFAKVAGTTGGAFKKAFDKDASTAVMMFLRGLKKAGKDAIPVLQEMELDDIRLKDALLRASAGVDTMAKSLVVGRDAWVQNNALTKEANERYKTTESRLKLVKAQFNELGIVVGDDFKGSLVDAAEAMKPIVEAMRDLRPETRQTIEILGAMGIAIGPLMIFFGAIAKAFTILGGAATAAGVAAAAVPVLIGLAIGTIIVLLMDLYAYVTTGESTFQGLWQAIAGFGEGIKEIFNEITLTVKESIAVWIDWINMAISAINGLSGMKIPTIPGMQQIPGLGAPGVAPGQAVGPKVVSLPGGRQGPVNINQHVNVAKPEHVKTAARGGVDGALAGAKKKTNRPMTGNRSV